MAGQPFGKIKTFPEEETTVCIEQSSVNITDFPELMFFD